MGRFFKAISNGKDLREKLVLSLSIMAIWASLSIFDPCRICKVVVILVSRSDCQLVSFEAYTTAPSSTGCGKGG